MTTETTYFAIHQQVQDYLTSANSNKADSNKADSNKLLESLLDLPAAGEDVPYSLLHPNTNAVDWDWALGTELFSIFRRARQCPPPTLLEGEIRAVNKAFRALPPTSGAEQKSQELANLDFELIGIEEPRAIQFEPPAEHQAARDRYAAILLAFLRRRNRISPSWREDASKTRKLVIDQSAIGATDAISPGLRQRARLLEQRFGLKEEVLILKEATSWAERIRGIELLALFVSEHGRQPCDPASALENPAGNESLRTGSECVTPSHSPPTGPAEGPAGPESARTSPSAISGSQVINVYPAPRKNIPVTFTQGTTPRSKLTGAPIVEIGRSGPSLDLIQQARREQICGYLAGATSKIAHIRDPASLVKASGLLANLSARSMKTKITEDDLTESISNAHEIASLVPH